MDGKFGPKSSRAMRAYIRKPNRKDQLRCLLGDHYWIQHPRFCYSVHYCAFCKKGYV